MGDNGPHSPSATRIGDEQAPNKRLPLIVVWLVRSVKELAPAYRLPKASPAVASVTCDEYELRDGIFSRAYLRRSTNAFQRIFSPPFSPLVLAVFMVRKPHCKDASPSTPIPGTARCAHSAAPARRHVDYIPELGRLGPFAPSHEATQ